MKEKLIPYAMTDTGKPKLDAEIVEKMVRDEVPYAKEYQLWAKLDSSLSKWYLAYPAMTGPDGRLRTVFKQTAVRSGRTSVERVNTQAMPHDYQLASRLPAGVPTPRDCVVARPGYQLWGLDLQQAELRVAARWAPCEPMLELIRSGADLHGVTATELFGVRPGDPDWTMYRQVAKRANFSLIFDIGAAEFQRMISKFLGLNWDIDRVRALIDRWRALYPQFRRAVYRAMHSAQHRRYVKLANGRPSWFDRLDLLKDPELHKAFNRWVQASLAELGAEWMIWIEQEHPGILVNWVHDAAYLEVEVEQGWRVEQIASQGAKMFTEMFDVPGGVDTHLEAEAA